MGALGWPRAGACQLEALGTPMTRVLTFASAGLALTLTLLTGCDKGSDEQQKANAAQAEADKKSEANKEAVVKTTAAQVEADKTIATAQAEFGKRREDYRHKLQTDLIDLDKKVEALEAKAKAAAGRTKPDLDLSLTQTLHVHVRDADNSRRLRCGTSTLSLDAAAHDAFELGACDRSTDATPLHLVHRRELFDHSESPPRPRATGITATRTETGGASGRAEGGGGSEAWCQASVQPYMNDLENGGRVALTPGRYVMRSKQDGVDVRPSGNGWAIIARRGTSLDVDYEVVDTKRGEVVFRDKVAMHCSSGGGVTPPPDVVATPPSQDTVVTVDSQAHDTPTQTVDWKGHALVVSLITGVAYLRTGGLLFANNGGVQDSASFGLRDVAAPAFGLGVAYERPWLYTSLSGTAAWASEGSRTLYHVGISSVVGGALHVGDTTLYLGPNVLFGTHELSGQGTGGFQWNARPAFALGAAAGMRVHLRSEKGTAAYVLGFELLAPVAGQQPWLFAASLGFGSSE